MLELHPTKGGERVTGGKPVVIRKQHALGSASCGPDPIALFVPHAAGWLLIRLSDNPNVLALNRVPLASSAFLHYQDLVRLGRSSYRVMDVDPGNAPAFAAGSENTACTLLLGEQQASVREGTLLIGAAAQCALRLPGGESSIRAVVARVAGRWVLHDVSGEKIRRSDDEKYRWVALADGDTVYLGDHEVRVEIALADEFVPVEPEDRPEIETAVIDEPGEFEPDVPALLPARPAPSSVTTVVRANDHTEAAPTPPADVLRGAAVRVCVWLRQAHKDPDRAGPPPELPPRAAFGLRKLLSNDAALLDRLHDVVADPFRGPALLDLARTLLRCGHTDLYRKALERRFFLDQTNRPVAQMLAESYYQAARATPDRDRRIRLLEEADGYWQKADELRAEARGAKDFEFGRLGTNIKADLLTARVSGPRPASAGGAE